MTAIRLSTQADTAALAELWRASVRATHDFLLDAVRDAVPIRCCTCARNRAGAFPSGFK